LHDVQTDYTFVTKLQTLYIMNELNWISARLLVSEFIAWAKAEKKEGFNYNLFKRTKNTDFESMTDRQRLVYDFAREFKQIRETERQLAEPAA